MAAGLLSNIFVSKGDLAAVLADLRRQQSDVERLIREREVRQHSTMDLLERLKDLRARAESARAESENRD